MATITNSLCTNGIQTVLQSGTGTISIGQTNNNKIINIGANTSNASRSDTINIGTSGGSSGTVINIGTGSSTSSTQLILASGAGGISITANAGGPTVINANSGGDLDVGSNNTAQSINFGTGSGAKTITLGSTTTTSSLTINTGSGGITIPSFTTTGALVSNASGVITDANANTTGYVLTSNGASTAPSFQAAGGGGGGFTWNNTTGATQTMAVSNGYVSNDGATLVTFTLPSTASVGAQVAVLGSATGLWTVAQNSGQTIHFNAVNSTTGVSGSVSSTSQYDSITLICNVANTDWVVYQAAGNLNVV